MMEDVARLASLAKGTVYNYFTSKEELYFSIMRQRMEKLISSLKNKIADEKTSIDSLAFLHHSYLYVYDEIPDLLPDVPERISEG